MKLVSIDYVVIVIYFAASFGLGLLWSRRAGRSMSEYFLSGRQAPWWLAGTGMVATTFAADTPLFVAGQVAKSGIAANWIWWCAAAGGMLTVFFFARLWRRAGVVTDLEFVELRYGGSVAAFLRAFKSVYFGLFMNCVIIGWVNLAMLKILAIAFPDFDPRIALLIVAAVTVMYVSVAGLWGVAIADAFQFSVALAGCILLAVFALNAPALLEQGGLRASLPDHVFAFFPDFSTAGETSAAAVAAHAGAEAGTQAAGPVAFQLPLSAFLAFVLIQWWASWYPGAEPGGGGYVAQRIMSARDEKHGMLATLWFVIAHYCVRSWPWILAGLAAVVLYPALAADQKESGYVLLMRDLLPAGLLGMLLAAFFGAYMSTLSTQFNWGSSYLINDLYKRFMAPGRDDRHYVAVARVATLLIFAVSLLLTFYVLDDRISKAWEIVLECGAGTGFVLILRWYWWRVNALSELVSMIVPTLTVIVMRLILPALVPEYSAPGFPESLFVLVGLTVPATLVAIYFTAPEKPEILRAFYDVVRPPGPGWKPFHAQPGEGAGLGRAALGWLAGTALVYALLFGLGSLFLGDYTSAVYLLAGAAVAAGLVFIVIRREFKESA